MDFLPTEIMKENGNRLATDRLHKSDESLVIFIQKPLIYYQK